MIAEAAFTALGWSLAAGAWAFCLAAYPLVLAYVYVCRRAWWAFADSLDELRETWPENLEAA